MTIGELINNPEFLFNVKFMIVEFDFYKNKEIIVYTSDDEEDCPVDLLRKDIMAINQGCFGVLQIECARN